MSSETVFEGNGFAISRIVTAPLDNNVYLITCTTTGASLIVDASSEPEAIAALAEGTDVRGVVTTHGHWDHHGAIPEVSDRLDVPFMLHSDDAEIAGKTPDTTLIEGPAEIGNVKAHILHTPGHTTGSVCFLCEHMIFTGDTLFAGGYGRSDLEGGEEDMLLASVRDKIFTRDETTIIYAGHGPTTTIGQEKKQNWILTRLAPPDP